VTFKELVRLMVEADTVLAQRELFMAGAPVEFADVVKRGSHV
jgi:hypothetical protein